MNARRATLPLTALIIVTSQTPFPRSAVIPLQQQREPLFPVQPFEVPNAPQPTAQQSHPATPAPPALLLESLRNLPNLKPRVVCGMTLIPANPAIDPKIAQKEDPEKPKDPTTYTIRPVQPSICW